MLRPIVIGLLLAALQGPALAEPPTDGSIGYTEFRTNLPGGRHA